MLATFIINEEPESRVRGHTNPDLRVTAADSIGGSITQTISSASTIVAIGSAESSRG